MFVFVAGLPPFARQAEIVLDQMKRCVEAAGHAVVEPLVVWHVGVRRVDADGLADELGDGAALLDEAVEGLAGAELVARGLGRRRHGGPSANVKRSIDPAAAATAGRHAIMAGA